MLLLRVGLNAPHRPPEILILHKPSGRCGSNPAARSPSHEWPESAHLARSARPGEGHLAEPIADVQPARREPLFMPPLRPLPHGRIMNDRARAAGEPSTFPSDLRVERIGRAEFPMNVADERSKSFWMDDASVVEAPPLKTDEKC